MARIEHEADTNTRERTLVWRKTLDGTVSGTPRSRVALANIDTNAAQGAKAAARQAAALSASEHMPKMGNRLFSPPEKPKMKAAGTSTSGLKRRRDAVSPLAQKRVKMDKDLQQDAQHGHKLSDREWEQMWSIKFPTLKFYFEIGTTQGAGKHIVSRVLKMGAVSYSLVGIS